MREAGNTKCGRGNGATKDSHTTSGSVNGHNHSGNWLAVSTKAAPVTTLPPQVYAKQKCTQAYPKLREKARGSTICNEPALEAVQMPICNGLGEYPVGMNVPHSSENQLTAVKRQYGWFSQTECGVREARLKRPHCMIPLYEGQAKVATLGVRRGQS